MPIILRMVRFILVFGISILAAPAFAGEDCTCSNKGAKTPEGQKACIKTSKGMQMAECSRVLNNTSWKLLGTPCPTSALDINKIQTNFNFQEAKVRLKKLG